MKKFISIVLIWLLAAGPYQAVYGMKTAKQSEEEFFKAFNDEKHKHYTKYHPEIIGNIRTLNTSRHAYELISEIRHPGDYGLKTRPAAYRIELPYCYQVDEYVKKPRNSVFFLSSQNKKAADTEALNYFVEFDKQYDVDYLSFFNELEYRDKFRGLKSNLETNKILLEGELKTLKEKIKKFTAKKSLNEQEVKDKKVLLGQKKEKMLEIKAFNFVILEKKKENWKRMEYGELYKINDDLLREISDRQEWLARKTVPGTRTIREKEMLKKEKEVEILQDVIKEKIKTVHQGFQLIQDRILAIQHDLDEQKNKEIEEKKKFEDLKKRFSNGERVKGVKEQQEKTLRDTTRNLAFYQSYHQNYEKWRSEVFKEAYTTSFLKARSEPRQRLATDILRLLQYKTEPLSPDHDIAFKVTSIIATAERLRHENALILAYLELYKLKHGQRSIHQVFNLETGTYIPAREHGAEQIRNLIITSGPSKNDWGAERLGGKIKQNGSTYFFRSTSMDKIHFKKYFAIEDSKTLEDSFQATKIFSQPFNLKEAFKRALERKDLTHYRYLAAFRSNNELPLSKNICNQFNEFLASLKQPILLSEVCNSFINGFRGLQSHGGTPSEVQSIVNNALVVDNLLSQGNELDLEEKIKTGATLLNKELNDWYEKHFRKIRDMQYGENVENFPQQQPQNVDLHLEKTSNLALPPLKPSGVGNVRQTRTLHPCV